MLTICRHTCRIPWLARGFSALQPALEADLISLLGKDGITTSSAILETHGHDESYHRSNPPHAVVYPRSTQQVSAVVAACAAAHTPIIPFGAGTSLEGHIAALQGGVCLDMTQMDDIIDVQIENMQCWVQAGVTREALNTHLRDTGLFFPIDPGANATLGGMASTRASGTMAVKYGTMRDNVRALTVVLPDGSVIQTGRAVKKSSAGYDLTALFVGSEGTLGVITEVALKLYPQPESSAAAVCSFPNLGAAVDAATLVMQSGVPVARIELLDGLAIDAVNRYSHTDLTVAPTLFFEFHGSASAVEEAAQAAGVLARESGGSAEFQWAKSAEERSALWAARHSAYYAAIALRPGCRGFPTDMCVPLSNLTECVLRCQEVLKTKGLVAPLLSHVGDSNFHLILVLDPSNPLELSTATQAVDEMVGIAHSLGGTCTGEHGVGYGKLHHMRNEWGDGPLQVMHAIKSAIDPGNLMNPGKMGGDPATFIDIHDEGVL